MGSHQNNGVIKMNVCLKAIFTLVFICGFGFKASADNPYKEMQKQREKQQKQEEKRKEKEVKNFPQSIECHWFGTPHQDEAPQQPLCNGEAHTVGLAQCAGLIRTAYCRTSFAGNVNDC